MRWHVKGQSLMEYVLLVTIVVVTASLMLPKVKRVTQSLIKSASDQLGDQKGAEQDFNAEGAAYVWSANTAIRTSTDNFRSDKNGIINKTYNEITTTLSNTVTNTFAEDKD